MTGPQSLRPSLSRVCSNAISEEAVPLPQRSSFEKHLTGESQGSAVDNIRRGQERAAEGNFIKTALRKESLGLLQSPLSSQRPGFEQEVQSAAKCCLSSLSLPLHLEHGGSRALLRHFMRQECAVYNQI